MLAIRFFEVLTTPKQKQIILKAERFHRSVENTTLLRKKSLFYCPRRTS